MNSPDPIANNRAIGWDYTSTLNLRYPVDQRFFLTDVVGAGGSSYQNTALFSNQRTFSEGVDVNIVYDSKLTLFGAYDFTLAKTHDTNSYGNSYNLGASGTILPKVHGSISLGYSLDQNTYTHQPSEEFTGIDAAGNLVWQFSRAISFTGTATKDFAIASTDVTTDTTDLGIAGSTVVAKRFQTQLGVTRVTTDFLGRAGLGRKDTLWEFVANLGTPLTTHININLAYAYELNYSNFSNSSFVRETITLDLTAKY